MSLQRFGYKKTMVFILGVLLIASMYVCVHVYMHMHKPNEHIAVHRSANFT